MSENMEIAPTSDSNVEDNQSRINDAFVKDLIDNPTSLTVLVIRLDPDSLSAVEKSTLLAREDFHDGVLAKFRRDAVTGARSVFSAALDNIQKIGYGREKFTCDPVAVFIVKGKIEEIRKTKLDRLFKDEIAKWVELGFKEEDIS